MKGRTVGGIARQATQVAVLNQKSFMALKVLVWLTFDIHLYNGSSQLVYWLVEYVVDGFFDNPII